MKLHANAKLGPAGRLALVQAIAGGMTQKQAAACFCVAPATAHRWWSRWLAASSQERATGRWLCDRSSRPRRSPRQLSAAEEAPILKARRETNLGPGRLAGIVGKARSTIWKVLHRHGLSRLRRGERQTFVRYEWSRPGRCCTSTWPSWRVFAVPATASPPTAQRRATSAATCSGWSTCTA